MNVLWYVSLIEQCSYSWQRSGRNFEEKNRSRRVWMDSVADLTEFLERKIRSKLLIKIFPMISEIQIPNHQNWVNSLKSYVISEKKTCMKIDPFHYIPIYLVMAITTLSVKNMLQFDELNQFSATLSLPLLLLFPLLPILIAQWT